jgi:hypothetical protein
MTTAVTGPPLMAPRSLSFWYKPAFSTTSFTVNISRGYQFRPEFLAISPNNRIPAIVGHEPEDGGKPISAFDRLLSCFISPKRPESYALRLPPQAPGQPMAVLANG